MTRTAHARQRTAHADCRTACLQLPGSRSAQQTPAAVHAAVKTLHAAPVPSASVFADSYAAAETSTATAEAGQHCASAAAAALQELAKMLTMLAPADIDFGTEPAASALASVRSELTAASSARPAGNRRGLRDGVLIEEVTQEAQSEPQPERLSAAKVVLLCGVYAQDDALAGAWVTADTSAAARGILQSLAGKQASARAGRDGPLTHDEQGSNADAQAAVGSEEAPAAVQRLILRVLPDVLRLLRPTLGKPEELRRQAQTAVHMPPITFNEGELLQ